MSITVFSKPGCGACTWTKNILNTLDVEYVVKDVSKDQESYNEVVELGYMQMPVVKIEKDGKEPVVWSGRKTETEIKEILAV